jgi:dihydrofolate reductase
VFVTMDGVMEAPGGEPSHPYTGWVEPYFSPELFEAKKQETLDVESLLVGRLTYESLREGWSSGEGEFADKMNAMGKDVVTSSPDDLTWNAVDVRGRRHRRRAGVEGRRRRPDAGDREPHARACPARARAGR